MAQLKLFFSYVSTNQSFVDLPWLKSCGPSVMQTLEVGVFNLIDEIRALVTKRKYIVTLHARDRMDQRGISTEDLVNIIMNGEIIEDYPDSRPCPSSLVAGMVAGSHCHTVVALCRNHLRIITVYWPGDDEWIDHRMRRQS